MLKLISKMRLKKVEFWVHSVHYFLTLRNFVLVGYKLKVQIIYSSVKKNMFQKFKNYLIYIE